MSKVTVPQDTTDVNALKRCLSDLANELEEVSKQNSDLSREIAELKKALEKTQSV